MHYAYIISFYTNSHLTVKVVNQYLFFYFSYTYYYDSVNNVTYMIEI